MKKFMMLAFTCGLVVFLAAGCADIAEVQEKQGAETEAVSDRNVQAMETAVTEEGYYILEGYLHEIGKHDLTLKLEEGDLLYFPLAPETMIYTGGGSEMKEGQMIRVVFDLKTEELQTEKALVIAVTTLEEM